MYCRPYYSVTVGYDRMNLGEYPKVEGGSRMTLAKSKIPALKKQREFSVRPHDWEKYCRKKDLGNSLLLGLILCIFPNILY